MATLKMYTNDGNHIWLPNIKRVEQTCYIETDPKCDSNAFPWDVVNDYIEGFKTHNLRLYEVTRKRIQTYPNKSALTSPKETMLLLMVVLNQGGNYHNDEDVQNWIVEPGKNFLLENGKTVDRI